MSKPSSGRAGGWVDVQGGAERRAWRRMSRRGGRADDQAGWVSRRAAGTCSSKSNVEAIGLNRSWATIWCVGGPSVWADLREWATLVGQPSPNARVGHAYGFAADVGEPQVLRWLRQLFDQRVG